MRRLFKSFGYALAGIGHTTKTQLNFKIHLLAIVLVAVFGYLFKLSLNEWLWIVLAIGLVLVTELLNTALELLVDLVSPGFNELAGKVKDVAAGAVLVAACIAVVIGGLIFIPKFI